MGDSRQFRKDEAAPASAPDTDTGFDRWARRIVMICLVTVAAVVMLSVVVSFVAALTDPSSLHPDCGFGGCRGR